MAKKSTNNHVKSDIAQAIQIMRTARKYIAAFAAKRAAQQLNTGSLRQISAELEAIERKLSVYDKN